jgi:hypothetical protein
LAEFVAILGCAGDSGAVPTPNLAANGGQPSGRAVDDVNHASICSAKVSARHAHREVAPV